MKVLSLIILIMMSSNAYAYCVHYNDFGQCDQQDQFSQQRDQRERNNTYIKPLPVIPPIGATNCNWVLINNQWQSICR